jgi:predicted acyl esterase
VPLLSAANWGGHGLHPRGNFEGFMHAASEEKWLDAHGLEHWTTFYTDYGVNMQKKFFGHYLKGAATGWTKEPRVRLQIRHPGPRFVERHENEWPLARTRWTKYYLHPDDYLLSTAPQRTPAATTYGGFAEGATFLTRPLESDLEITGPIAAKLWVSSTTEDADLFVVLRAFRADLKEAVFQGSNDPHTPIALGWLRVSRRRLDPERTLPYRPYHVHGEIQPMQPGEIYEVDVEVWPTCIVVPKGYRLGFTVRGKDYEAQGDPVVFGPFKPYTGVALFTHDDPQDRPAHVFGGDVTLHTGPSRQAHVLLPVIPAK